MRGLEESTVEILNGESGEVRRNINDLNNSEKGESSQDPGGGPKEDEATVEHGKPGDSQKQDVHSNPEEVRSRFYEDYRKVAEEYDKEFMKRYDEDLNTTLIFAGLFSAVTSAFITQVDSQLQQDPNEETAALLRVLIYKMDNTTFGGDTPTIPQWSGPPRAIVQVQAILYASLTASLFSAFLAMLGKQWLNRYASANVRGTAIERSQNRQRKLDGIVEWYFEYVMESLPLMLQAALLLLGCALYLYLWGIDTTIASVVLGVTLFGIAFYFFIVIAGMVSRSCPYQTPGSRVLRSASLATVAATLTVASAFRRAVKHSKTVRVVRKKKWLHELWWSRDNAKAWFKRVRRKLPGALASDASHLWQAMVQPLVASTRRLYTRLLDTPSTPPHRLDRQTTFLDIRCISWIIQTPLDKVIHLSALESLATMVPLASFDPTLVTDCFNIFISCVKIINRTVVITQGSERLATMSSACLLHTLSHLSVMDPTSDVFGDLHQRYSKFFPPEADFDDLPSSHVCRAIHRMFNPDNYHSWFGWGDYRPSGHEHAVFACALARLAQSEYQRKDRQKKVPRWILRFVLHSLSLDPPPPAPVIVDCLSIIAIDLDCDVSVGTTILSESERIYEVWTMISRKLETMIKAANPNQIYSRRKAITVFFSCTALEERTGQLKVPDLFLGAARASMQQGFMWHRVKPLVITMLNEESSISLKQAIILVLPHLPLILEDNRHFIQLFAAAASTVPYTDEICQSVVDVLLRNALSLPDTPIGVWSWLNKRPSLPPLCDSRVMGSRREVVQMVRALGDIETLTSYLLLVWSEWDYLSLGGFREMCASIREDFGGVTKAHHREDLLEHLNRVLEGLDRGLGYLKQRNPYLDEGAIQRMKVGYGQLKEELLRVDREQ